MNRLTRSLKLASFVCALAFTNNALSLPLGAKFLLASTVGEQWGQAVASKGQTVRFTRPSLPSRGAPSGRYRGGGSKGKCPPVAQPLTALVPVYELNPDGTRPAWTLTVSDRPVFWFYVPYPLTADLPLEFVLQDDQGQQLYQTTFTQRAATPGIIHVQLPPTVPSLQVGKRYHWYFLTYCDDLGPFVDGWVERTTVSADLQHHLQQMAIREQIDFYTTHGLWHEALTKLAERIQQAPKDSERIADWASLLRSAGVEDAIANAPLVDCCTASK
ncbi:MAG: DUF928 domain-containing protein [Leptolyngbya sp. BL-A-14]